MIRAPERKPIAKDEAEQAAKMLGLELIPAIIDPTLVAHAYRMTARTFHPDVGGDPEYAAILLQRAKEARTTLLRWIEEQPKEDCPTCRGSGYVRSGAFGVSKPCTRCML